MTKQELKRAIKRIESEITTIYEEGLDSKDQWYAFNRLMTIKKIVDAALQNNPESAVADFPDETKKEKQKMMEWLDRQLTL